MGTLLPLGTHFVVCQVAGSMSSNIIAVSVVDTTAPAIHGASDRTAECTGPAGAIVNYAVSATDASDPAPNLVLTPPSGSLLPRGTTPVRCVAWDNRGNTNQTEFTVTVADTLAPQINCPPDATLIKTWSDGAEFPYQLFVADAGDSNLLVQCSVPSGGTFAPGTTTVNCIVMDSSGNRSTCSFNVTVMNADPGRITDFNAATHLVDMSFPTQPGVEYVIEYKNSLDEPGWQPLAIVVGDGTVMRVNDPEPAESMRFYRVRAP
jgi:hypothetical protein